MQIYRCSVCGHVKINAAQPAVCESCGIAGRYVGTIDPEDAEKINYDDVLIAAHTRRDFFAALGWGTLVLTGGVAGFASLKYVFPMVLFEPPSVLKIGRPDDYVIGSTAFLERGKFFVIRSQEGVKVMSGICTHLGCTVRWVQDFNEFHCPCHGSKYHADGVNFAGPAPRPLRVFQVTLVTDGQLVVDTGIDVKRDSVLKI